MVVYLSQSPEYIGDKGKLELWDTNWSDFATKTIGNERYAKSSILGSTYFYLHRNFCTTLWQYENQHSMIVEKNLPIPPQYTTAQSIQDTKLFQQPKVLGTNLSYFFDIHYFFSFIKIFNKFYLIPLYHMVKSHSIIKVLLTLLCISLIKIRDPHASNVNRII